MIGLTCICPDEYLDFSMISAYAIDSLSNIQEGSSANRPLPIPALVVRSFGLAGSRHDVPAGHPSIPVAMAKSSGKYGTWIVQAVAMSTSWQAHYSSAGGAGAGKSWGSTLTACGSGQPAPWPYYSYITLNSPKISPFIIRGIRSVGVKNVAI